MEAYCKTATSYRPVGRIRSPTPFVPDSVSPDDRSRSDDLLRVAFYDTVKADGIDTSFSIMLTEHKNRAMAESHPDWEYAGTYIDRRPCRDAFQRLVKDSDDLDMVAVRSYTRFDRRIEKALEMIRRIKCPVFFTDLNVLTDSPGWEECIVILKVCEGEWAGSWRCAECLRANKSRMRFIR